MDSYYQKYFADSSNDDDDDDEDNWDEEWVSDNDEKVDYTDTESVGRKSKGSAAPATRRQKLKPKLKPQSQPQPQPQPKSNKPKRRRVKFADEMENLDDRTNYEKSAGSRTTEIKVANRHLREWYKMIHNDKNPMENRAWLADQIVHLEARLDKLYKDEKRLIYGSASKLAALDRRTQNVNLFWIPKIIAGIEQRKIS